MRVLYVLDEHTGKPVTGGSCRALCEMALKLRDGFGVEPIVVASVEDSNTKRLRDAGIEVHIVPYGSFMVSRPWVTWKVPLKWAWCLFRYACLTPLGMHQLSREIDFSTIDLIHTNINRTDLGARLAARYDIPHIWHIREFPDLFFHSWSYRSYPGEYISKWADWVICISDAVRSHWISAFGLNQSNSCVVYDGVDSSGFIENMGYQNREIRFVIIGNIIEGKGQLEVAKAFSRLPSEVRAKSTLDMYGEGDPRYINQIHQFIDKSGLTSSIRLRGLIDDVPKVLSEYDVGITASRAEGFGRVTVEYMMAGLAVVASDTGANRELLTGADGRLCGLLYDYGDDDAMTNCLERLADDEVLRRDLAVRGKARGGFFTAEANAAAVYNLYCELLSDGCAAFCNADKSD